MDKEVQLTPVEKEVHRLQIREQGCRVCIHRVTFAGAGVGCSQGLTFPKCRRGNGQSDDVGFRLDPTA